MENREKELIARRAAKLRKQCLVAVIAMLVALLPALLLFVVSLSMNIGAVIISSLILAFGTAVIVFFIMVRRNPMRFKKFFLYLQTREERNMAKGSIDRADWHYNSAEELFREQHSVTGELTQDQVNLIWLMASNHIGLFVQWIIDRGFEGVEADEEGCSKVRDRELNGVIYFMRYCDGKLWWSDIREDIHPFVEEYYAGDSATYLDDYVDCCLSDDVPCYGTITGEEDYLKLKERIDSAYGKFLEIQA